MLRKSNPRNRDCLATIYLGKWRDLNRRASKAFTLRNFILHLDQMEELNLDLNLEFNAFAVGMANALAVMHWRSNIDSDDVEFVLGGSPSLNIIVSPPEASLLKTLPLNFENRVISSPSRNAYTSDANCV